MAVAFVAIAGFAIDAEAQVETDSTFIFNYNPEWNAPDANADPNIDIIDFDSTDVEEKTPLAADRRNQKKKREKRDWSTWRPDTKKALWLAIVLPGAGQIYNRKYWKLPIVYGGFIGCIYAMRWNNMMYNDYSQAYIDIMDNDPQTQSYNQFLHLGAQITESNKTRYQDLFRRRKDYYPISKSVEVGSDRTQLLAHVLTNHIMPFHRHDINPLIKEENNNTNDRYEEKTFFNYCRNVYRQFLCLRAV